MDQRTKRTLWIVADRGASWSRWWSTTTSRRRRSSSSASSCPPIILHEISHGWVANAFGDDTAKRAGRLTLNPLVHVDPLGTLIVPALLSLSSLGVFGWAKPVPVNVGRLRSPRNEGVAGVAWPARRPTRCWPRSSPSCSSRRFGPACRSGGRRPRNCRSRRQIVFFASLVNVGLCVFNMIPIPPLDGSVLFERLLPARYWPTYLKYRRTRCRSSWVSSC